MGRKKIHTVKHWGCGIEMLVLYEELLSIRTDFIHSFILLMFLFFFDNITYRRAIEEREIKYHFISRCSKGTPLAQRAIKLTLLTAHYFIAR